MITAVVTKKGRILQNKQVKGADLTFTRAVAGTASTPVEELKEKTSITNVVQTLPIQSITSDEKNLSYTILVMLENSSLTKSFNLSQIGFYANDPNDGEILFAIAQFDTPKKIETPTVEPGYTLEMPFTFQNSNEANVTVEFDPDNLMSRAGVEAMLNSEEISKKASGNSIMVMDSAESPFLDFRVFGKSEQETTEGCQLIQFPYQYNTIEASGIKFTKEDDGGVNVIGTATANSYFIMNGGFADSKSPIPDWLKSGEQFTISGGTSDIGVALYLYTDAGETVSFISFGSSSTFDMPSGFSYYGIFVQVPSGKTVNKTVYPMLNKGATAIEYEKYTGHIPAPNPDYPQELDSTGNGGSVEITTVNKNLYNCRDVVEGEMYNAGVIGNDDFITIECDNTAGMNTAYKNFWTNPIKHLKKNTNYRIVVEVKELVNCGLYAVSRKTPEFTESQFKENLVIQQTGTFSQVITTNDQDWTKTVYALRTFVQFSAGMSGKCVFRISLQQYDDVSTEYVPYAETKADIPTPNGLHCVPVPSGGNFTDKNGQEWLCDEINLAKRKYIRRTHIFSANATDNGKVLGKTIRFSVDLPINAPYEIGTDLEMGYGICSHLPFLNKYSDDTPHFYTQGKLAWIFLPIKCGTTVDEVNAWLAENPLKIIYQMATPIETDLTEEQIAAIESLLAHEGTTNIFMDGIGNMEVQYFKDTENGKAMGILKSEHIYLKKLIGDVNKVVAGLVG